MKVGVETNVLVVAVVRDDPEQAEAEKAQDCRNLFEPELMRSLGIDYLGNRPGGACVDLPRRARR